jgi:uncharacterized protein (DUF305 family)
MQTHAHNAIQTPDEDLNRRRFTTRDIALALMSLIASAALLLFWMNRLPSEGSNEVVFARDMIAHHEQAVEMSIYINQRPDSSDEMRLFTLDMMITQHGQVGQMQGWLRAWGQTLSSGEPPMGGMAEHMGMASREQVQALETLPIDEAEVQFLQLMIRHHQGGVFMAEDVLHQTKRPEVLQLAQAIIAAQESEIKYMTELLAKRNAEPLAPLQRMDHSGH